MISAHCQSKCEAVGNQSNVWAFPLLGSVRSIQSPSMRLHDGYIKRFHKMGTLSSGGLCQLRFELLAMNSTFPPAAILASASSQELVTRTFRSRDGEQSPGSTADSKCRATYSSGSPAGYTQKFHSF